MKTIYAYRKKYIRICLILIIILFLDLITCCFIERYQVNKLKSNIQKIEEKFELEEKIYE